MGTPNNSARSIVKIKRDLATDPDATLNNADAHVIGLDREVMLAIFETDIAPYVGDLPLTTLAEVCVDGNSNKAIWVESLVSCSLDGSQQIVDFAFPPSFHGRETRNGSASLRLTRKRTWIVCRTVHSDGKYIPSSYVFQEHDSLEGAYQAVCSLSSDTYNGYQQPKTIASVIIDWLYLSFASAIVKREMMDLQMRGSRDAAMRRMHNLELKGVVQSRMGNLH